MAGPWKLSALGVVALAATVSTSTLSTAYLMRPPAAPTILEPDADDPPGPPRPAIVRITPVTPHRPVPHATSRRDACGAGSGAAAQGEREARDTSARHGAPSCGGMASVSSAPAPAAP